ncbi:MAG: signal peptidase I [Clostridia bacterium]|nr:signal peptidase I [Clostridia bacterium]
MDQNEKKVIEAEVKNEVPKKSIKQEIFEWIMVFVVAAALAFVVRTFIFEPVRVDGASMMDTLVDGEYMIATKFDYLLGDPERFDIVICNYPNTNDGMYRVKRVIGMPGDIIQLLSGQLYINGEHVEQDFDMHSITANYGPYTVPQDHYFVLGDNRNNSKDSRSALVGPLPRNMIKGHVRAVVFPFGNFRLMAD